MPVLHVFTPVEYATYGSPDAAPPVVNAMAAFEFTLVLSTLVTLYPKVPPVFVTAVATFPDTFNSVVG